MWAPTELFLLMRLTMLLNSIILTIFTIMLTGDSESFIVSQPSPLKFLVLLHVCRMWERNIKKK